MPTRFFKIGQKMRLHLNDVEDVTENIILTGRSLREMRLRFFSPQGGPYCQAIGVKKGGMNRWDTVSYKDSMLCCSGGYRPLHMYQIS